MKAFLRPTLLFLIILIASTVSPALFAQSAGVVRGKVTATGGGKLPQDIAGSCVQGGKRSIRHHLKQQSTCGGEGTARPSASKLLFPCDSVRPAVDRREHAI